MVAPQERNLLAKSEQNPDLDHTQGKLPASKNAILPVDLAEHGLYIPPTRAEARRQRALFLMKARTELHTFAPLSENTHVQTIPVEEPQTENKPPLRIWDRAKQHALKLGRIAAVASVLVGGQAITKDAAAQPLNPNNRPAIGTPLDQETDAPQVNIDPDFVNYWNTHGGLAQQGLPLAPAFSEREEDGNVYKVQYFERAKFELHPEIADPNYKILLSRMGVEEYKKKYPGLEVNADTPIDPTFLPYWQTHGALAQQGFALGSAKMEIAEDGNTYLTQYFERAVMEYHPENAKDHPDYVILLKRIGAKQFNDKYPNGNESPQPLAEFGDPKRIMFHNKAANAGLVETHIDNIHTIDALYAAIDKYFPGTKYNINVLNTSADVQTLIDQSPKKPDYDNNIRWDNGDTTLMFYKQESDGSYSLYFNLPKIDPNNQRLKNSVDYGVNDLIFTLPYKKDDPLHNTPPSDYGAKVLIPQVLAPYNKGNGDMKFTFNTLYQPK